MNINGMLPSIGKSRQHIFTKLWKQYWCKINVALINDNISNYV